MSEKEKSGNKPQDFKSGKDFVKAKGITEVVGWMEKTRLARKTINALVRAEIYTRMLATRNGRDALRDPERRRFFFDREARTGLLLDSIFNHELYFPNEEGSSLEYKTTVAGRFVSYDFHRPEEFNSIAKAKSRQRNEGRLVVFALNEIKDHDKDDYTPTDLFNLFDFFHMLSFDTLSIEEAVKQGYLIQTTYEEAYRKVGLYDKYRTYLELQQLSDKSLYAVTPKGNGVVALIRDGGEKQKQPRGARQLRPVPPFPI